MNDEKSIGVEEPDPSIRETPTKPPPPPGAEQPTPQEVRDAMAAVGTKLGVIETKVDQIKAELDEVSSDVHQLYALLMGIPDPAVVPLTTADESGRKKVGGIGMVFHKWNNHLQTIASGVVTMVDNHKAYANEVARVHEENVRIMRNLERIKLVGALRMLDEEDAIDSDTGGEGKRS